MIAWPGRWCACAVQGSGAGRWRFLGSAIAMVEHGRPCHDEATDTHTHDDIHTDTALNRQPCPALPCPAPNNMASARQLAR